MGSSDLSVGAAATVTKPLVTLFGGWLTSKALFSLREHYSIIISSDYDKLGQKRKNVGFSARYISSNIFLLRGI